MELQRGRTQCEAGTRHTGGGTPGRTEGANRGRARRGGGAARIVSEEGGGNQQWRCPGFGMRGGSESSRSTVANDMCGSIQWVGGWVGREVSYFRCICA